PPARGPFLAAGRLASLVEERNLGLISARIERRPIACDAVRVLGRLAGPVEECDRGPVAMRVERRPIACDAVLVLGRLAGLVAVRTLGLIAARVERRSVIGDAVLASGRLPDLVEVPCPYQVSSLIIVDLPDRDAILIRSWFTMTQCVALLDINTYCR